jgi:DNA-binding PadR family transcriptional regulator
MTELALVKGTLDVLVLKALSWTPMHGFEITTWLEERSGRTLDINDSALYQALYRMIAAEWGVTENRRRARYYRITRAGTEHLQAGTAQFLRYAETVAGILTAAPDPAQAGTA